jgi:hypothetical protein
MYTAGSSPRCLQLIEIEDPHDCIDQLSIKGFKPRKIKLQRGVFPISTGLFDKVEELVVIGNEHDASIHTHTSSLFPSVRVLILHHCDTNINFSAFVNLTTLVAVNVVTCSIGRGNQLPPRFLEFPPTLQSLRMDRYNPIISIEAKKPQSIIELCASAAVLRSSATVTPLTAQNIATEWPNLNCLVCTSVIHYDPKERENEVETEVTTQLRSCSITIASVDILRFCLEFPQLENLDIRVYVFSLSHYITGFKRLKRLLSLSLSFETISYTPADGYDWGFLTSLRYLKVPVAQMVVDSIRGSKLPSLETLIFTRFDPRTYDTSLNLYHDFFPTKCPNLIMFDMRDLPKSRPYQLTRPQIIRYKKWSPKLRFVGISGSKDILDVVFFKVAHLSHCDQNHVHIPSGVDARLVNMDKWIIGYPELARFDHQLPDSGCVCGWPYSTPAVYEYMKIIGRVTDCP